MPRIVTTATSGLNQSLSSSPQPARLLAPNPVVKFIPGPPGPQGPAGDGAADPAFLALEDVYIDPDLGSDDNDGTQESPLATPAEWLRRASRGVVTVSQTVHVPPGTHLGDLDGDLVVATGERITIEGERTELYSSTFTSVTPWDFSAETQARYVDTALPTGWSASGLVNKLITFENVGEALGWVLAPDGVDPRSALVTPPVDEAAFDNASPVVGTAFTVWDMPTIQGTLSLRCRSLNGAGAPIRVRFLRIDAQGANAPFMLYGGDAQFEGCHFATGNQSYVQAGFPAFFACLFDTSMNVRAGGAILFSGGAFRKHLDASFGGSITFDYQTVAHGAQARLGVFNAGILEVFFQGYGIVFVSTAQAIHAGVNGTVRLFSKLWGNGSGAAAFTVEPGALVTYAAGEAPTVAGFSSDLIVGGTARTYAQLPYTNPDALAAVRQV